MKEHSYEVNGQHSATLSGRAWKHNGPLLRSPAIKRVIVLRALPGLGDLLCAIPALRALRQALPKAHIDLLGLSSTRRLADRYSHYVDGLIDLPGFPGLVEQAPHVAALPPFLSRMQARRYNLALQMHGSGSITNVLALLLGAEKTAGFYLPQQFCPDPATFWLYPEDTHEIQRNLALVRSLGADASDESYEFPLTPGDRDAFERLAQRHRLRRGQYVCVHAGARDPVRRWSPESFAQCSRQLRNEGLQIVLTGTQSEMAATAAVANELGAPLVNLCGQTELGTLALLLKHARLVLCNDTGVSHLAAAMNAPSVVIFLASDPRRWAPPDRARHMALSAGEGRISTEQAYAAIRTLLDRTETASTRAAASIVNSTASRLSQSREK